MAKAVYILGDSPVLSRALETVEMVQRCSDFQHCIPRYQLGFWSWVVFSIFSFFGKSLDLSVTRASKTFGPEVPSVEFDNNDYDYSL